VSALNPNTLFLGLVVLVAIWLGLLVWLWRRLIARHPAKYEAMGRPSFFSPVGLVPMMRFLFLREHRPLDDRALSLGADAALIVFALYILGFVLHAFSAGVLR
jgi:hypothetical protein